MKDFLFRIIQVSDIHHFSDNQQTLLGVNTHDSFISVLDLLKKEESEKKLILLTGDLSQDETEMAYIHVSDAMKEFNVPVYWIPGNHDDMQIIMQVYPRNNIFNQKHIILEHWHIILLDSHKQMAVEGYLAQEQLEFMRNCLDQYPEHDAIIAFHHHPMPVGCAWLDKLGLTNADVLWDTLKQYPRVKAIFSGHVHQQYESEKNGIQYFSTPSTCVQFKPKSDTFALEKIPPGYRWIDLYPDGKLKTGICRVSDYIGEFEQNAKGY